MVCKTSQISIRKRHYCNNIFLQFRRFSKCTASKSVLKDSFFDSTNTPLETWIVVLDSWIKEHKLQVRAFIEKNLLLLNHSGKSILLPPQPVINALPSFNGYTPFMKISSPILAHAKICQLLASIIQVYKYNNIIIIHIYNNNIIIYIYEKLEDYIDRQGKIENCNFETRLMKRKTSKPIVGTNPPPINVHYSILCQQFRQHPCLKPFVK